MRFLTVALGAFLLGGCIPYYAASPHPRPHSQAQVQAWVWVGHYSAHTLQYTGYWELRWVDPRMLHQHPHRYIRYTGGRYRPPAKPTTRPGHRRRPGK
jgi:hypothetical protein